MGYFGEMEMSEQILNTEATLRDVIAMYALSALIANRIQFPWQEAYKIADHMMEERAK